MNNDLIKRSCNTDETEQIRSVIAHTPSNHLLHLLHAIQRHCLHISPRAINEVALHLKLPVSQVDAVVGFYSFFHTRPQGRYSILFSNCTSCGYLASGDNLMQMLVEKLGVTAGETRADGAVSIAETSCIGMCDHGSAMLLNDMPITGLDAEKIGRIAALVSAEKPLEEWPREWFSIDDNIRHKSLLLNTDPAIDCECLREMLARGADNILDEITRSGLRGRGGAGFSTGIKWKFCREAKGAAHYVVCNADEGEPGTFKDRILLHSHADKVFEGMTLCGRVIGAEKGFLYLRGEYRYLLPHLQAVLAGRRDSGLLGPASKQGDFVFDIEIIVGAGAYICGEESALIESMEGKRGIPRIRPPFPVTHGYLGQPTVVNNVETFFAAAQIVLHGSAWFKAAGTEKSAGSKILSISGDCAAPGIYEYPFGVTIRQVLQDCGAKDVQAVQIGGPSGTLISNSEFERKLGFEDLPTGGSFMVFGHKRDLLSILSNFAHFFAHESCGFCTPCRVGTTLLKNGLDKIVGGHGTPYDIDEMRRMAALVKRRSHCGMGQTAANHLLDSMQRFPQLFEQRLVHSDFEPHFNLDAALEEARKLSRRDDAAAHLE